VTYTTEIHFKIYDDGNGAALRVGPDADGLDLVEVEGGHDYGRLVLPPEMARRLASVLVQVADSVEASSS
jgi:hypothetical protein